MKDMEKVRRDTIYNDMLKYPSRLRRQLSDRPYILTAEYRRRELLEKMDRRRY